MCIKERIKEYWEVFRTNLYDVRQMERNLNNLQITCILLAAFSLLMSVMNLARHHYGTMVATAVLCIVFFSSWLLTRYPKGRPVAMTMCVVASVIIFTYFVMFGGSNGFAVLWTLPAPVFIMVSIGLRAGTWVGIYFFGLSCVLFWTPLRFLVEAYYTDTFMNRFPLLYLCMLLVCVATMLASKKQQMQISKHQEELEEAVRQEHIKVSQVTVQAISTITRLVDAKDQDTDDHSIRVAMYSCLIADELGWDKREIESLYHTALLHDIGKVGIRDDILKKRASLKDDEYNIMKTHTTIGAAILKELSFMQGADVGALYHHEKYDGTGYPHGLKGEEIPLCARIIAVADSFDAMNARRVYREQCDKAYILEEMGKCCGTQFDPRVVAAFLRCVEKDRIEIGNRALR